MKGSRKRIQKGKRQPSKDSSDVTRSITHPGDEIMFQSKELAERRMNNATNRSDEQEANMVKCLKENNILHRDCRS